MTDPIGLSERLRQMPSSLNDACRTMEEAATALDALQERVKDCEEVLADKRRLAREIDVALHGEEGAAKQPSLCDLVEPARQLRARVKEMTSLLVTSEDLRRKVIDVAEQWQSRATRAEQERDEALERLKPFADASESLDESHLDRMDLWESPSAMDITAGHLRAARDCVRRLASGPDKEKK